MNERMKPLKRVLMISGAVLAVLMVPAFFSGCKQKEPVAHPQSQEPAQTAMQAADQVAAAVTTAQKLCPIMDAPINEAIFVEYEGKKVYFCCKGCEEKFLADPAKYVAKLPQFQQ